MLVSAPREPHRREAHHREPRRPEPRLARWIRSTRFAMMRFATMQFAMMRFAQGAHQHPTASPTGQRTPLGFLTVPAKIFRVTASEAAPQTNKA